MDTVVARELINMGFAHDRVLRVTNGGTAVDLAVALEALLSEGKEGDMSDERVLMLGISQYTFSEVGASACSSICASALIFLLEHYERGDRRGGFVSLNEATLGDAVTAGVVAHAELSAGGVHDDVSAHMSVEDLIMLRQDVSDQLLKVHTDVPLQGLVSDPSAFDRLLNHSARLAPNPRKPLGIVITKPPETVLVLLIGGEEEGEKKYVLFDPHSRPQLGFEGSYLVESPRRADIVARLRCLFPSCDGLDFGGGGMDTYAFEALSSFEMNVYQLVVRAT